MHRLRAALGAGLFRTQPYQLGAHVDADFLAVRDALSAGRVRDTAESYRGPLLPASEAPAVRDERVQLALALRTAVLATGDPDAMWSFIATQDGADDLGLAEHLLHALRPADPPRAVAHARLSSRRDDPRDRRGHR